MKINNKNKLLIAGIIFIAIISYKFAIAKTLGLRSELYKLRSEMVEMQDTPRRTQILALKNKVYDSILDQMDMGDNSLQNNLLRLINAEAKNNNVKVMDFNRPHISTVGANQYYTYGFNLNGSYTDILKIIHVVEQKGNFGNVAHMNFEKNKNYRTNTYSLGATVFVQHVK